MEKCHDETPDNFSMVKETIKQYINHLKSLTGQPMNQEHHDEITEVMCKNMEAAFAIRKHLDAIENHLINEVFLPRLKEVCHEKFDLQIKANEYDFVSSSKDTGIYMFRPSWRFFKIVFNFSSKRLKDAYIGIVQSGGGDEKFEDLKKCFPDKEWEEKELEIRKYFSDYSTWDTKEAMMAILDGEKMVNIFKQEIESILKVTENLKM